MWGVGVHLQLETIIPITVNIEHNPLHCQPGLGLFSTASSQALNRVPRGPGGGTSCPWEARAALLLKQNKKLASREMLPPNSVRGPGLASCSQLS